MALPTTFPSDWHPCKGCICNNHAIPSYKFSVTDADSPIADHTDLRKLTRSNDAPNPSEEKTLQGMLSDSGKRIDALDAQVLELKALRQDLVQSITRVDQNLAALDKERRRLSDSVRERRLLLSALRRMPKEALAHIFLHAVVFPFPRVEPTGNLLSYGDWSAFSASKHPLLSFELVSRNWKDVLDAFPNLWSYVNILIDRMLFSTYTRYIGNQLSRSRQCPLSISICHSENTSVTRLGAFPVAISMALSSVSHRVRTLHLCLPGRCFAYMQQLHLSFPSLQELVLLSSSETSEVAQHLYFGSLPCLRVFRATDVSNIDKLSLPWHQITHFTNVHTRAGREPPVRRVLDILKMMSRLAICHLSLDRQSLATEVVEEMTLSQLHSLTLSNVYSQVDSVPPVIPIVLNSLILPALLDLSVTCFLDLDNTWRDRVVFASIRQLIERSHSPLTSLYFGNGKILKDDLIHILSSTPSLQDIRLINMNGVITDEVLNDLTRRVDTGSGSHVPMLVPHLHTLHLSGYFSFQVELYVQMVEFRWMCRPRHLKSVTICRFFRSWDVNYREEEVKLLVFSRLDVLQSEGLDVTMSMQSV
ncbi:uncharacterized protein EV420DRAFT_471476 [Desarmillaria tabescens]|uniref:F-box domain-containing protein n=1 Tax=Armillaria tabescens TaxID=1929756 RepID=A0AA39N4J1_ARMTA|nr:uncharacterized protein EV420DRAFT_471476 [Desarmillaria tabescens]KAK0457652.1 hypothetical protein EV420DRAFT_471476 [Desarmillaria tabescens]